ncbi:MAG: hypothetical protein ACRD1Z_11175, partial [Vicinamibacteria bacterium]
VLFRVEASILYFNSEHVRGEIWNRIRSLSTPRPAWYWATSPRRLMSMSPARGCFGNCTMS